MEQTQQQLASLIATINEKLPEGNDLKHFLGISKSVITDSLTQSANQLITLKEFDNHFETIILKRDLAEIFEKAKEELKGVFADMKPSVFNSLLKRVSKIRFLVKETYISLISAGQFRTEDEISKMKIMSEALLQQAEGLKLQLSNSSTLSHTSEETMAQAVKLVTKAKDEFVVAIGASAQHVAELQQTVSTDMNLQQQEIKATADAMNLLSIASNQQQDDLLAKQKIIDEYVSKIETSNAKIELIEKNVVTWNIEIEKDKEEIVANKNLYQDLNTNSGALISNIEKANLKINGKPDADGKPTDGYLFGFQKMKERMESYQVEQEKKYDSQFAEIEGLLPGATSAGLAQAYQDQKSSYQSPIVIWSIVFVVTLLGMTGFSVWVIVNQIQTRSIQDLNSALTAILKYLPFYVPTIWLVAYASKQQSQSKRLQQEYAFKETNAKSFHGHKVQIEELMKEGATDTELLEKLVTSLVYITAQNPSETLENKSHNDSPPIMKMMEKFIPTFKSKKEEV